MRVETTERAREAIRRVQAAGRDKLVMVLSNGCCDSTAPYLYEDHVTEPDAREVGRVEDVAVLAPAWLAALYAGESLTIDVAEGILDDSFSLETEFDLRFVLRTNEEGRA